MSDLLPYLFPVGAAATFAAAGRFAPGPAVGWIAGAAAFAAAVGRSPLALFLALMLVPTVLAGVAALRRQGGQRTLLALAASDLVLAAACTQRYAATASWVLPGAGEFGPGAVLLGVAAGLRLLAVQDDAPDPRWATHSLGWWQGLYLAWLAGPAALPALLAAWAAAWSVGVVLVRQGERAGGYAIGGGLAALLAGLGAAPPLLAVTGLAGAAFGLGERAGAAWTLGILPLLAGWRLGVEPGLEGPALLALAAFSAAWALTAAGLAPPEEERPSAGAVVGALAGAAALALGVLRPEVAMWLAYGLVLAAPAALSLAAPSQGAPDRWAATTPSPPGGPVPSPPEPSGPVAGPEGWNLPPVLAAPPSLGWGSSPAALGAATPPPAWSWQGGPSTPPEPAAPPEPGPGAATPPPAWSWQGAPSTPPEPAAPPEPRSVGAGPQTGGHVWAWQRQPEPPPPEPEPPRPKRRGASRPRRPAVSRPEPPAPPTARLVAATGWALLAPALAMAARLALLGLSTGFL